MRKIVLLLVLCLLVGCSAKTVEPVVVAYASCGGGELPNPEDVTHINVAFGGVNATFDGIEMRDTIFLKRVVELKKTHPNLHVLLSIGGWTAGGFSEMASDETRRQHFAEDCGRWVEHFGLDGIDMDWEYPSSSEAGISALPEDIQNFTLLMQDIRRVIGKNKLLTAATIADALYIDFPAVKPYIDFVNVMAYDVARPPYHHSPIHRCSLAGRITVEEALNAHLEAGLDPEQIVLGVPFYGHGHEPISDFLDYRDILRLQGYEYIWNDTAKVPVLVDSIGTIMMCYDDSASIAEKCRYVLGRGFRGMMYWETKCDDSVRTLARTVANEVLRKKQ
ncbi:MAG: glycosyl hydrolase family 18 protein [Paludibacteraceae bacterium]|nr:glycosyl hydrolase family 18 protein [Paludibacteraceae bacterium]